MRFFLWWRYNNGNATFRETGWRLLRGWRALIDGHPVLVSWYRRILQGGGASG
jgi:hypothetical protein